MNPNINPIGPLITGAFQIIALFLVIFFIIYSKINSKKINSKKINIDKRFTLHVTVNKKVLITDEIIDHIKKHGDVEMVGKDGFFYYTYLNIEETRKLIAETCNIDYNLFNVSYNRTFTVIPPVN